MRYIDEYDLEYGHDDDNFSGTPESELQYFFDIDGLAGEPDVFDEEFEPGTLGLHWSNLFDQDEDEAGEAYDLANGETFNNSSRLTLPGMRIIEIPDDCEVLEITPVLGKTSENTGHINTADIRHFDTEATEFGNVA